VDETAGTHVDFLRLSFNYRDGTRLVPGDVPNGLDDRAGIKSADRNAGQ